jgi:hypothetical protein
MLKRVVLGCLLFLSLVGGVKFVFGAMDEDWGARRSLEERGASHSVLFRMGELKFFPNDVVKFEAKPVFYFCGEFCPVKIVSPSLQIEKKSFIKIKAN